MKSSPTSTTIPDFQAFDWPRIEKAVGFYLGYEGGAPADPAKHPRRSSAANSPSRSRMVRPSRSAPKPIASKSRKTDACASSITRPARRPALTKCVSGFAPQLTLEAAMVAEGAFADIGAREVSEALYLKLGGGDGGKQILLDWSKKKIKVRRRRRAPSQRTRSPAQPVPPDKTRLTCLVRFRNMPRNSAITTISPA